MIRTAILALYLTVLIVVFGPLLILYGLCFGSTSTYYRVGVDWALFPFRLLGIRTRVEGIENIPSGPCLFASNHTSNADPPIIVKAIPRRMAVLIKKSIFNIPIMGKAFRIAHFIPVEREPRRGDEQHSRGVGTNENRAVVFDFSGGHAQPGRAGCFRLSVLDLPWPSKRVCRWCR